LWQRAADRLNCSRGCKFGTCYHHAVRWLQAIDDHQGASTASLHSAGSVWPWVGCRALRQSCCQKSCRFLPAKGGVATELIGHNFFFYKILLQWKALPIQKTWQHLPVQTLGRHHSAGEGAPSARPRHENQAGFNAGWRGSVGQDANPDKLCQDWHPDPQHRATRNGWRLNQAENQRKQCLRVRSCKRSVSC